MREIQLLLMSTCIATHCNALQHTATHYNALQHTIAATHCNTLQRTATHDLIHLYVQYASSRVCCSMLQYVIVVAVCSIML